MMVTMHQDDEPLTGAERAHYWAVAEGGGTELLRARFLSHSFGLHSHPTYTFAVVTAGAEQYRYRGALHRTGPGEIALLHPDEPHDGCRAVEEGWHYHVMYVPTDAFAALDPDRPRQPTFGQSVVGDPELSARFVALHRAFAAAPSLAREEGFLSLLADMAERHGRSSAPRLGHNGHEPGPVARVRAYLDTHSAEPVPLARLAEIAGLHPLSLIRAFRRSVGMPPHAYQTARRVLLAQSLLRQGLAPAAVALDCGFADQSHLSRAFKRVVGVPPGRYRQGTFKTEG